MTAIILWPYSNMATGLQICKDRLITKNKNNDLRYALWTERSVRWFQRHQRCAWSNQIIHDLPPLFRSGTLRNKTFRRRHKLLDGGENICCTGSCPTFIGLFLWNISQEEEPCRRILVLKTLPSRLWHFLIAHKGPDKHTDNQYSYKHHKTKKLGDLQMSKARNYHCCKKDLTRRKTWAKFKVIRFHTNRDEINNGSM